MSEAMELQRSMSAAQGHRESFLAAILGADEAEGTYLFQECEPQPDGTLVARKGHRRDMAYRRNGRRGWVDWSIVNHVVRMDVVTVESTGAVEHWFDGPLAPRAGTDAAPLVEGGSKAT